MPPDSGTINKNKTTNPTKDRIKTTKCKAYSLLINLIATSLVEKQNTATIALKDPKIAVLGLANNFIFKRLQFYYKILYVCSDTKL